MGPGDRKVLIGTVLNRFPNVRREYLSQVRSGICKLRTGCVAEAELRAYICSLEGKIRYIAALAPHKSQKLSAELQKAVALAVPH